MLNGNPAVDIFNGMKLAAGGELGIGVGEEDWGSGEREVLEGFIERTEGLKDLVVSRFGEPAAEAANPSKGSTNAFRMPKAKAEKREWLGAGAAPGPSDGVIFSGVGVLTRTSLRDVSDWMQWLYAHGEDAYGVRENPTSTHRRKRRRIQPQEMNDLATHENKHGPIPLDSSAQRSPRHEKQGSNANGGRQQERPAGIPPPIISAARQSSSKASTSARAARDRSATREHTENNSSVEPSSSTSNADTLMKYLTLGVYGSSWGVSSARPAVQRRESVHTRRTNRVNPTDSQEVAAMKHIDPKAEPTVDEDRELANTNCRFIIGLQGNLEESEAEEDDAEMVESPTDQEDGPRDSNSRILIRALHVKLSKAKALDTTSEEHEQSKWKQNTCGSQWLILVA